MFLRGTSTIEGLGIAHAIAESLIDLRVSLLYLLWIIALDSPGVGLLLFRYVSI